MEDRRLAGKRILIVEDDADITEMIATIVDEEGGQTCSAPTARRAAELLVEDGAHLDAVILDLRLPDEDGAEMIGRLQDAARATIPPILVISAWPPEMLDREAKAIGAKAILAKPFGTDELVRTLTNLFRP